jgi:hypothetical protein
MTDSEISEKKRPYPVLKYSANILLQEICEIKKIFY